MLLRLDDRCVVTGIGKQAEKFSDDWIGRQPYHSEVVSQVRPAVQATGPARDVAAFESVEERRRDLCRRRNLVDRDALSYTGRLQARAKRSSRLGQHQFTCRGIFRRVKQESRSIARATQPRAPRVARGGDEIFSETTVRDSYTSFRTGSQKVMLVPRVTARGWPSSHANESPESAYTSSSALSSRRSRLRFGRTCHRAPKSTTV
jgi:hypothetical protein